MEIITEDFRYLIKIYGIMQRRKNTFNDSKYVFLLGKSDIVDEKNKNDCWYLEKCIIM